MDFDEGDVVWDRRRRGVRRRVAAWEQKSRRVVGIGRLGRKGTTTREDGALSGGVDGLG